MSPSKIIIVLAVLAVVLYAAFAFDIPYRNKVDDFATCIAAGNTVLRSYPEQCQDEKGNTYVNEIASSSLSDMVRLINPSAGAPIASPVSITGEARGPWYFEASFPVEVISSDGAVLGKGIAQAKGDWMTPEFVPFTATITFAPGSVEAGAIRLRNANPSGDPSRDYHVDVPVKFASRASGTTTAACRPTGCSGQICSDQDVVSTCEYQPKYACYANARCERQADGKCGWTETPSLRACLNNPPRE